MKELLNQKLKWWVYLDRRARISFLLADRVSSSLSRRLWTRVKRSVAIGLEDHRERLQLRQQKAL